MLQPPEPFTASLLGGGERKNLPGDAREPHTLGMERMEFWQGLLGFFWGGGSTESSQCRPRVTERHPACLTITIPHCPSSIHGDKHLLATQPGLKVHFGNSFGWRGLKEAGRKLSTEP